jgi:AAA domain
MTQPDPDFPLPPERFVGRRAALQTLCQRLRQRELFSSQVVGGPRTGKTSLLHYLASDLAAGMLADAQRCIRVYVDAHGLGSQATPHTFWLKVFRELETRSAAADVSSSLRDLTATARASAEASELDLFDLEDVFDAFGRLQRPVVVLADEIDSIVAGASFQPPSDFFNQIRSLGQRTPRGLAFVVTTMRPLGDIVGTAAGPSPFYNHFGSVPLGPLGRDDLLELLGDRVPPPAVAPAVDDLMAYSGGHPYLVSHVLQRWSPPLSLGESLGDLASDVDGPFVRLGQQILSVLTPHERAIVTTALEDPALLLEGQRATLAKLRKYSLLPPGLPEVDR